MKRFDKKIVWEDKEGYLVEDGIYMLKKHELFLDMNKDYGKEFAVLGEGEPMSTQVMVIYLTYEREKYEVLKKRKHYLGGEFYLYQEFKTETKKNYHYTEISFSEFIRQQEELDKIPIDIENGAEELIKGQGYRNLEVMFQSPFFKKDFYNSYYMHYNTAYRLGNDLILINNTVRRGEVRKKFDMRLMSLLVIRKKIKVSEDLTHTIYYPVIDKGEMIWQELLTEEMYKKYVLFGRELYE